jgi:pyridoxine 5-phosphate synthase
MPTQLSVNINKVATLRNSRGGNVPSLEQAIAVILRAGACGITVHPRQDARHITLADVRAVAAQLAQQGAGVEYNIEGDPRADLMDLVCQVRPQQCTLVPVRHGELTSEAGWDPSGAHGDLKQVVERLKQNGIRVSLFVDPKAEPIRWAKALGADRVELYTEPYAAAFARGTGKESFERYAVSARLAHELGLGVNAGHDLDLENLPLFRTLPHLDEVSIGHALISRALFFGLEGVVREYLDCLAQ